MSRVLAVVPTLGWSGRLRDALAALRRDAREGGEELAICVVWQGEGEPPAGLDGDRILRPRANLGFSGAVNLALAESSSELVALVNDDVVVAPGWLGALRAALAESPRAAAAQGVNLLDDDGAARDGAARVDGCGLAWNRAWQAVQIGRGGPPPPPDTPPFETFGVSATAALYRREALDGASRRPGEVLDAALFAYYEDVDLACRLRGRGRSALAVPAARARHVGSATGGRLAGHRWRWIHAHRLLVLARLLGRAFWPRLPRLLLRDLADALAIGDGPGPVALGAAWAAALRGLPRFARRGAPLVPLAELARFRVGCDGWPPLPPR